jgi:hypothetical protein
MEIPYKPSRLYLHTVFLPIFNTEPCANGTHVVPIGIAFEKCTKTHLIVKS